MAPHSSPFQELRRRLGDAEEKARQYQAEGLPFPTGQLLTEYDQAVRAGDVEKAEAVVKRAEALLARADQDWGWLRELLQRVDGLRAIADTIGLDLARIDAQVGNPRGQLLSETLTPASIEKAAAGASFALAVLNDALPKYVIQEARVLGASIRRARDRGEDVREAAELFAALLRSLQDPVLDASAERLVEVRRAVARIPRAPAVATISPEEEDEILREARNLARRLHRIKTRAHDATDAVRLLSQVRQALSEDRRYASPEEEVEALWAEVDRLTREKRLAAAGPALDTSAAPPPEAVSPMEGPADVDEEPLEEEAEAAEPVREPPPVRLVPPVVPVPVTGVIRPEVVPRPVPPPAPLAPLRESPSRIPTPIVPPMNPLPDEQAGAPPPQSPDTLAEGAGPRVPRPTRIAIAAAYVPPDLAGGTAAPPAAASAPPKPGAPPPGGATPAPAGSPSILPPPGPPQRRIRSRHRE